MTENSGCDNVLVFLLHGNIQLFSNFGQIIFFHCLGKLFFCRVFLSCQNIGFYSKSFKKSFVMKLLTSKFLKKITENYLRKHILKCQAFLIKNKCLQIFLRLVANAILSSIRFLIIREQHNRRFPITQYDVSNELYNSTE